MNTFRGNLFNESRGTLTLRHGNGSVVENNVFLGNRVDHTGGIRVINKRQTIRNNYLHGLTGHRFRRRTGHHEWCAELTDQSLPPGRKCNH